jgi:plastocyanin
MIRVLIVLTALATYLLPSSAPARAQTPAVVEGTVVADLGPDRKTASRYPAGVVSSRSMQRVAPVVYLVGEGLGSGVVNGAQTSVDVVQRDTAFAPSAIVIRSGTTVRFPNEDPFFHNVYSYATNARFDLGRYPEGESRQVVFPRPGIARVFCEVHEFMRAVIVVTDHPYHALVDEDGSFRIEGVPPGAYTLVVYHPDVGSIERSVEVAEGRRVRVDLALEPSERPLP